MSAGTGRTGTRTRRAAPWVLLAVGVLGVGFLTGSPPDEGLPLDPTSPGQLGTKALVEMVRSLGGEVTVRPGAPRPDDDVALVLVDDLRGEARRRTTAWVEAGGTLVVTDPSSELSPAEPAGAAGFGILDPELLPGCDLPALDPVGRVSVPGAYLLKVPRGAVGCFPGGDESWMVVSGRGRGTIVALGGAGALVNSEIDRADNAVLAATLLVPTRAERVVVLAPPLPGEGRKSLRELVPSAVKLAIVQLAIAFVVMAAWRARRLGRPVTDVLPVVVPASDLVAAVGELTQRSRARDQAATVLRDDLRRTLALRFGLPVDAPAPVLVEVLAARGALSGGAEERDMSVEEAANVLGGPAVADEAALLDLARGLELLHRRARRG